MFYALCNKDFYFILVSSLSSLVARARSLTHTVPYAHGTHIFLYIKLNPLQVYLPRTGPGFHRWKDCLRISILSPSPLLGIKTSDSIFGSVGIKANAILSPSTPFHPYFTIPLASHQWEKPSASPTQDPLPPLFGCRPFPSQRHLL